MDNNEENENEVKPIHENVRVLVVDDSEFARKQITNIVENLGLTVAGEASTPSESIEAIAIPNGFALSLCPIPVY